MSTFLMGLLAVGASAGAGAIIGSLSPTPNSGRKGAIVGTLVAGGLGLTLAGVDQNWRGVGLTASGIAATLFPIEELLMKADGI